MGGKGQGKEGVKEKEGETWRMGREGEGRKEGDRGGQDNKGQGSSMSCSLD